MQYFGYLSGWYTSIKSFKSYQLSSPKESKPILCQIGFLDFDYFNCYVIYFIGKCLNKLKLDICICSSQDITIALCLVITLALISFFYFFSSFSMRLLGFHLEYCCILLWLIRLTSYLKMGWTLRPKRHKNTWFSQKIK